jgi:NAD-dependent dihydropyrimidine dehydrogenase PreA subunit
MEREIIKIDEDKCNGCGLCIPNCHEGALQIIDGKAVLISDLMCDGLGACLGHCPEGALEIEMREAEPYDEVKVMEIMVSKGKNVVVAHLKHLKEHEEYEFLKEAVGYLKANANGLPFDFREVIGEVHNFQPGAAGHVHEPVQAKYEAPKVMMHAGGGCPSSRTVAFTPTSVIKGEGLAYQPVSQLTHWPVQMHLINPAAGHFKNSDLVLAADCAAFAHAGFHNDILKGKTLVIACPKLDSNKEIYVDNLVALIEQSKVNTITVVMMEVPCCSGLYQMVSMALQRSTRKVPVKNLVIGLQGEVLSEDWV